MPTAPLANVTMASRHVLELDRAGDPGRLRVDGLPGPHQVQQQVDLVDPVAERGSAALAGPVAAPVRQEVAVRAVPERLADGDLRRPRARPIASSWWARRAPDPCRCWKTHVDRAGARRLGGGQDVHVGQVGGRAASPAAPSSRARAARRRSRCGCPGGVATETRSGRWSSSSASEPYAVVRVVARRTSAARSGIDVDDADQLDAWVGQRRPGHGSRAIRRSRRCRPAASAAGRLAGVHRANPARRRAPAGPAMASRITSKVCRCGQAVSVRLITSCTRSG